MPTDNCHILFLAQTVQSFLRSGILALVAHDHVTVTLVAKSFDEPLAHPKVHILDFEQVDGSEILKQKVNGVVCAGWMEGRYLLWCKKIRHAQKVPTICCMDTPWTGSHKQRIHTFIAPFTTLKYFTHAWVPGKKQNDYAQRLGFAPKNILPELLAADVQFINTYYPAAIAQRFVYFGRLIERKLLPLLQVYHALQQALPDVWPLHIIGSGPLEHHELMQTPGITHLDFKTSEALMEDLKHGGTFVLASYNEPWAVSIQEAGAVGLPMIVSKQCGAAKRYVQEGENGFVVDAFNLKSIDEALLKMMRLSESQYTAMALASHKNCQRPDSQTWSDILLKALSKTH